MPKYLWKNGEIVKLKRGLGFVLEEEKIHEDKKIHEEKKEEEPKYEILADTILVKPPIAPLYATQKNKPQRTNIRFIF